MQEQASYKSVYVYCWESETVKKCSYLNLPSSNFKFFNACENANGSTFCNSCIQTYFDLLLKHPDCIIGNTESNPLRF